MLLCPDGQILEAMFPHLVESVKPEEWRIS